MNNYFELLGNDLKKLWEGLELPQKFAIIGLTLATCIAMSFFITKSMEPNWAVLYSDLYETDAVAVVENLKKGGYPYKISDDKKSILVPATLKEELRIQIAENDVIHDSSPGFELLDKMQIGATDFQNKLTKQRIFQGELTRTIERIRGVKKARVQIAAPERSVFATDDESPSASVMLILEPGYRLKPQQIKAVKNIVAYGIPRLSHDRVFVSDQNGTPLSEDINKSSNDIESFRTNFEVKIAKKVRKVIEKIVGYDNVTVEVTAMMNFDSAKSTIERYIPFQGEEGPEGVLSSSQTEKEVYDRGSATQDTQKDQGQQTGKLDKNKLNYEKQKSFSNYNVSKEIKQVVYAPGTVNRMTIAVAINKVLTSKEKEELTNLVVSASGADISRGDMVNVTSMQFASIAEDKTKASELLTELQTQSKKDFWVTKVAPLLVILILGLSALFVFNSIMKRPLEGQEVYGEYEPEEEYTSEERDLLEAANVPAIEAKLDPELERVKSELNGMILSDPAEASRLLLSFIKD